MDIIKKKYCRACGYDEYHYFECWYCEETFVTKKAVEIHGRKCKRKYKEEMFNQKED